MVSMRAKNLILGAFIGIIIGMVVSSVMTFQDWCLNPGGIFHSERQGTQWSFVWDTWISWFLPVTLTWVVIATIALYIYNYFR
jgi:H+/Cl- antiporter ClcA